MRSLGFYLYLPKLSSIKSLWLLRQKVKRGQGLERNLTFFYLSGRVKSCFFKVAFHILLSFKRFNIQSHSGSVITIFFPSMV